MRTFEERKEEIFRRSEERIAQRKKTIRRVVLTCVPMVLCIAILSGVVVHYGFGGMDNAAPEAAFNANLNYGCSDSMAESPECMPEPALDIASLQISRGAVTKTCTDTDILQMLQQILETPKSTAAGQMPESDAENASGWPTGDQIIKGEPYPLQLTCLDGTQVWYILRGNRLTREDGESYVLTPDQSAVLHALLEGEE